MRTNKLAGTATETVSLVTRDVFGLSIGAVTSRCENPHLN
ncbi:unknown (plasmid) [Haloarcula marismortui ATCC 43049]|uniref:Uncharacterized protein n=1 Tax=Haloarcula marismortui (strain ATCC 43049 / DSM 3752 / JCM 8966 / VKM B-1809) TaxID=272569 RepID=Q5V5X0_HALMA|nr:unknown [Haloarcula marismortui ATCC 43049]